MVGFATNAQGEVVSRYETNRGSPYINASYYAPAYAFAYYNDYAGPHEAWYRFAGREWGYVGNNELR